MNKKVEKKRRINEYFLIDNESFKIPSTKWNKVIINFWNLFNKNTERRL
jgi:hypothetical protein